MSNYKKEIREYYKDIESNEEKLLCIEDAIAELLDKTQDDQNKEQLKFYKQAQRMFMTKEKSFEYLTQAFGKPVKKKTIIYWDVKSNDFTNGLFVDDDKLDKTLSFVSRTPTREGCYISKVLLTVDYNQVERMIKYIKTYIKKH